jgi:co-chaperonin GroES (HSP10)
MDFSEIDLTNFLPLHDRILVKRFGDFHPVLVIPQVSRDFSKTAEVIAVGRGVRAEIKKGDLVLLPGIALTHPDFAHEDYAMITENDVGGILCDEGNA